MKKILAFIFMIGVLINPSFISANWSVIVSAIVGSLNSAPLVLSVNPDGNPWILWTQELQNYIIYFKDNEKDKIYYTITPWDNSWYVNKTSWVIEPSEYDWSNWAYINFLYVAPWIPNETAKIILTLNDWPNVTFKELKLYIY